MDAPIYRVSDKVQLKSRRDRGVGSIVGQPQARAGEYWYVVRFLTSHMEKHPEGDLEAVTEAISVESLFLDGKFASRDALSKLYTHLKLVTALRSQIYAMNASRTNFYAFQFKPLLKLLDSSRHRLLIADEVGLGKTIEAGLILTELRTRAEIKRVLVVAPAHLITKWQREMKSRFDLDLQIVDRKRAVDFLKLYQEEGDEARIMGVMSLQTARSKSLLDQWEAISPHLDVSIFDEAGRLRNTATKSNQVASVILENSDVGVLLTATPVQTSDEDLFNLLALLDPEQFDSYELFKVRLLANEPILKSLRLLRMADSSLEECAKVLRQVESTQLRKRFQINPLYQDVITRLEAVKTPTLDERVELQRDINGLHIFGHLISRTRKIEVDEARPIRRPSVIPVIPTEKEKEFYELITRICKEEYSQRSGDMVSTFVAITRQRQLASCMIAMLDHYRDEIDRRFFEGENTDVSAEDFGLTDEEIQKGLDTARRVGIVINDAESWRQALSSTDSKWNALSELIKRLDQEEPGRKIVLFTYFKKTLSYLEARLTEIGIKSVVISGDVKSVPEDPDNDERGKRLDAFKDDPKIRMLLSNEVGSEGIDLQFSHILINYDLPWNPMAVEQRIGRLDRIGQKSDRIIIYNLSMRGTIEERILRRLYDRIGIFESSIGDLEAILGEEVSHLTRDLFSRELSPEEQEERIARSAEIILRKKRELDDLEKSAATLIGHDEYFMDEIRRARENRRFVGGYELVVYIRDFLAVHHRDCGLEDIGDARYSLNVSPGLRNFVRVNIPLDMELKLFLNRSAFGSFKLTTNAQLAQEDRKIDFLTHHHPLVRAITEHYRRNQKELHPVSHVRVAAKETPPGIYAWFLFTYEISCARPLRDIDCIIVDTSTKDLLDAEKSERLLSRMVSHGESVPPEQRGINGMNYGDLYGISENTFVERLNNRYGQMAKHNDAIVTNKISSLEESFMRNVERRKSLLDKARASGRKTSYIKGLETSIRNMIENHEKKKIEIENMRDMGRSYELKGAGIVEVTDER